MLKERLKSYIEKDMTHKEISVIEGVSRRTIGNWFKKYDLKTSRQIKKDNLSKINKQKVVDLYFTERRSTEEISKLYGVNKSTVNRWIKAEGLALRNSSESKQIYKINQDYFDKINTKEKAYLLGFVAADGYTTDGNVFGVTVSTIDLDVINFIKKQLESEHPVRRFTRVLENNKIGDYSEFRISNKKIKDVLHSYSIEPRKSLTLNIEEVIKNSLMNESLIPSFLLGYFDGDGGIYHYNPEEGTEQFSMSITGTLETCNYYKKYFQDIGFLTKRHKDNKNNYTYQIGGRNQVKKALDLLYEDTPEFFFKRKHKIYLKL